MSNLTDKRRTRVVNACVLPSDGRLVLWTSRHAPVVERRGLVSVGNLSQKYRTADWA